LYLSLKLSFMFFIWRRNRVSRPTKCTVFYSLKSPYDLRSSHCIRWFTVGSMKARLITGRGRELERGRGQSSGYKPLTSWSAVTVEGTLSSSFVLG
jgi:hypothetical protein